MYACEGHNRYIKGVALLLFGGCLGLTNVAREQYLAQQFEQNI